MSTRSGKRIHLSFHENTLNTEPDVTRSERKTRSKHTKENSVDLQPVPKPKKQRNYVAYPGDSAGDHTESKDDGRKTRSLRKNALKERNCASSTACVEPPLDSKNVTKSQVTKSIISTRRTRKLAENTEDVLESISNDEQTVQKTKNDKKKKRKEGAAEIEATEVAGNEEEEQVTEVEVKAVPKKKKRKEGAAEIEATEVAGNEEEEQVTEVEVKAVPKKKSKKKKGQRTSSIIVEDIVPQAPSNLNKSNMSVDSFHSAAGSPQNTDNEAQQIEKDYEQVVEVRKTRSYNKLDNLTDDDIADKQPRTRKSSVRAHIDALEDIIPEENDNRRRNRKSSIHNASLSTDAKVDEKNSTINIEEKFISSTRKTRNATFDKTVTPNKINTTFDKDTTEKEAVLNETFDANENMELSVENVMNTTFEKDTVTESVRGKKRKSALNTIMQITNKQSPIKTNIRKYLDNETSNADENIPYNKKKSIKDSTENSSPMTEKFTINTTFDKDNEPSVEIDGKKNETFDLKSAPFKSGNDASSPIKNKNRKSVVDTTYEKDSVSNLVIENRKSFNAKLDNMIENINTTFEKGSADETFDTMTKRKSSAHLSLKADSHNSTFDIDGDKQLDTTFDKISKSSIITSDSSVMSLDKSNASRISITSDESKSEDNILNTTPLLIESSLDDSQMNTKRGTTPVRVDATTTPLKREGTFTKEESIVSSPKPNVLVSKTPTKRMSLPSPGFTPYHVNKSSSKEKSALLNVTRSIEKRRSSLAEPMRTTKVMFCSPVNNPAVVTQIKKKVIKSNLKGSNKSFVFDESDSRPVNRKRSYTQGDADDARAKRKRLANDLQQSVDRLSRPRTSSASAKLADPITPSKKPITPSKKTEAKISRTKLPNFASLHQKRFDRMESLGECQQRRARRARQLRTPSGPAAVLERISSKDEASQEKPLEKSKEAPEKIGEAREKSTEAPEKSKEAPKPETPIKSLPTFKSLNPGYTRFGFKLNLDVNPFSIPSNTTTNPKESKPNGLARQATLPSIAGATSSRREVAKRTVMREKSFTGRRNEKRTENRTIIKGVRTNRRFELQMRMRDI